MSSLCHGQHCAYATMWSAVATRFQGALSAKRLELGQHRQPIQPGLALALAKAEYFERACDGVACLLTKLQRSNCMSLLFVECFWQKATHVKLLQIPQLAQVVENLVDDIFCVQREALQACSTKHTQ